MQESVSLEILRNKQKSYAEQQEARAKGRDHLQDHIRKADDDYRNFIKEITKVWNDHRKAVKERKKLEKTDYYIE